MKIISDNVDINLDYKKDFVALTRRVTEEINIENSEMVFAGFGIIAPEYNWNDYQDLDIEGKTVVVLVNDPGFGSDDTTFFKGNTMTYYGRWTYKYEEAARQGAEAILIIHQTEPAGYPWGVVENGWTGANLYLISENNNLNRCAMEGWITEEAANKLFTASGKNDYDFTLAAKSRDFKPFTLGMNLSLSLKNSIKYSTTNNVLGVYPGTERSDEYIIYTAHWDHLGTGDPIDGDSIWNGAIDNASGIACMLEIADAFTKLPEKPLRSVLFLAVTAEEQGLLGSAYYAENPVYPIIKTVANINMDAIRAMGKMKDFTVIGYGHSDMDDYAKEAAEHQNRYVLPDTDPEKGYFFRSDHFNFAKVGVPALYAKGGYEHVEHGIEWTKEQQNDYTSNRYHKPFDEFNPDWDLSGMVLDAQLYFMIGEKLSNESTFPNWKEGSEFKAKRDMDMTSQ